MEQYCSCGTRLVEDALFCHKCGKPTREIVPEEEPESEPRVEAAEEEVGAPAPAAFQHQHVAAGFVEALAGPPAPANRYMLAQV